MREIDREFLTRVFRFGVSGALATGVHLLVALSFLTYILPSSALANAVAFVAANAVSYVLQTHWTFAGKLGDRKTLVRFLWVSLLGCCLSALIGAIADKMEASAIVGVLFVVTIVPIVTYVLHRRYTYAYQETLELSH